MKFHTVMVDKVLYTYGVKFYIPASTRMADLSPKDIFGAIPDPLPSKMNPIGLGAHVRTDIPDPNGDDDDVKWAYPAIRNIKFGGDFLVQRIPPKNLLVVDDTENT